MRGAAPAGPRPTATTRPGASRTAAASVMRSRRRAGPRCDLHHGNVGGQEPGHERGQIRAASPRSRGARRSRCVRGTGVHASSASDSTSTQLRARHAPRGGADRGVRPRRPGTARRRVGRRQVATSGQRRVREDGRIGRIHEVEPDLRRDLDRDARAPDRERGQVGADFRGRPREDRDDHARASAASPSPRPSWADAT